MNESDANDLRFCQVLKYSCLPCYPVVLGTSKQLANEPSSWLMRLKGRDCHLSLLRAIEFEAF